MRENKKQRSGAMRVVKGMHKAPALELARLLDLACDRVW